MGASQPLQDPAGTHSADGVESLSTLRSRMCEPLTDEGDGEFFCPHCESRCTRSPDGGREYGHALDCERRSEQRSRHTAGEPVVVGTNDQRSERSPVGPTRRASEMSDPSHGDEHDSPDTR